PSYPYSVLIRLAILGSPTKKLTLDDIYTAIETRFPFYKTAGSGWKQSVRHNLSVHQCFEKQRRPIFDPGKGSYWSVNESAE
ncbi:winged helix DNA-binding domain-containing protein, partial [Atractiella rhizophila]